jgi:hypothetical protein
MSDVVLLGKLVFALTCSLLAAFVMRRPLVDRLSAGAFTVAATSTLALARIAMYVGVLIIMAVPAQSDVLTYYSLAKSALAGLMPYRDFFNGYGPLFPTAVSMPVAIWDSPKSIIFLSLVIEVLALPVWIAAGRKVFPERVVRGAATLYILSPLAAISVALSGQNHVWLSLALASSLYFAADRRDAASGLVFGAGVVLAKFLSLLHAPVLLALAHKRWHWLVGFACLPVLVYGALFSQGVSLVNQMAYHASDHSSGNLPFLLTLFGIDVEAAGPNRVYNIVGLLTLVAVIATVFARYRRLSAEQSIYSVVLLLLTLMLVSRKAFTGYLVIGLFPMCLMVASDVRKTALPTFLVFAVVVALESSLWFRWMNGHPLDILWRDALPPDVSRATVIAFLGVQLALIGFYLRYALDAFRRLFQLSETEKLVEGARGIA